MNRFRNPKDFGDSTGSKEWYQIETPRRQISDGRIQEPRYIYHNVINMEKQKSEAEDWYQAVQKREKQQQPVYNAKAHIVTLNHQS